MGVSRRRNGNVSVEVVANLAVSLVAVYSMVLLLNYLLSKLYAMFCYLVSWPIL
jgi:hypothetical protein